MAAWNESLSNELKKLNMVQNPNSKQKARIAELKSIKAAGTNSAPAQTTGDALRAAWNEKLSDELKNLNLVKNPNAKQKARIAELKGIKAGGGGGTQPVVDTPATIDTVVQGNLEVADKAADKTDTLLDSVPVVYDLSQFNNLLPGYDEGKYKTAFEAAFANATYGLDDQETKRRKALDQELADKGVPMGQGVYDDKFKDVGDEFERYRGNARNYATSTASGEAARQFDLSRAAYDSAVGAYNMQFGKPIEFGNALSGISSGSYAIAAQDRQFQEDVRQFGQAAALEKWKVRQALANKGGGGGSGGSSTPSDPTPIIAGNGFQV